MNISKRIQAFAALGRFLKLFENNDFISASQDPHYLSFSDKLTTAFHHNGWFTEKSVRAAITGIVRILEKGQLEAWTTHYEPQLLSSQTKTPKRVGVIMAGNIPMVGFHDMLSVLMAGHIVVARLSSQDKILLPALAEILIDIQPEFNRYIFFAEQQFKEVDAIIATGSNNTSRYFEYYFKKYPSIIRKNRNSVAVLTGHETEQDLKNLGNDIFQYFGLGCRNVSKLFVPEGYDFDLFFKAIFDFKYVVENKKYGNNYDYNKTIYLMNQANLLENGFLLLKEDAAISSPVSMLFYEYYKDKTLLQKRLLADETSIQCIVSADKELKGSIPFGQAQYPHLWDYADGVDTMNFLLNLHG